MTYKFPQEVYDFCIQYNLDSSKIIQDQSDGLLIYDGDINLGFQDFKEVPKELLHFKEIKGYLSFYKCTNLESVENLRNLRRVGKWLSFIWCENLHSFDGLNPYVNIVGNYEGVKIYPPSRNQEFLDYIQSERERRLLKFVKDL